MAIPRRLCGAHRAARSNNSEPRRARVTALRRLSSLLAGAAATALVAVGAITAMPAASAHAASDVACVRATAGSGPYAETICWLRWDQLDVAAASAGSTPVTFTLDGGSTITMDVALTGTAFQVATVPTWSGAQFAQSVYKFSGNPPLALYSASGSLHNDQTVTLNNIKATYSSGRPMSDFSVVVADAETTYSGVNGDEYIDYSSDKPLSLISPLGNACLGGFSGDGTTSVHCLSGPYGNRPTTTPVLMAQSPSTMSAHMGEHFADGSQGVAFGIVVSSASVTKTVASRYASSDSFTVSAKNAVGTPMGSASTGTGTGVTAGPFLDLGTFTGSPAFTLEETGDGTTDLSKYTKKWTCTVAKTTSSGTVTTPLDLGGADTGSSVTVPASVEDAVACTVVNTAKPADILVTKTAVPATGNVVGKPYSYTITAKNQSDVAADGVTVSDTVPNGLTIGAISPAVTASGQTVSWPNQSFAARETKTYTIQVTPTAAGTYSNTAVATTDHGCQTDGTAADCSSTTNTDIKSGNNLKITKTVLTGQSAKPGEWVTYLLQLTNLDGQPTLADQTVTDDVPASLTNVSIVTPPTVGTAGLAGNKLTWTVPAGTTASPTVVIKGQLAATAQPGKLTNTASLSGGCDATATPSDCTSDATSTIAGKPADIVVTKQGPAAAPVGSQVTYTITATNTGDAATTKTNTVTDTLPPEIDPASVTVSVVPSGSTISQSNGTVTWTLPAGMLPASMGTTYQATVTGTIKASATPGTMTNTASLPSGSDCTTGCSSSVDTQVTSSTGALTLVKTASPADHVHPGDTVTYSLRVTNSGQGTVHAITVTDDDALFAADKVVCPTSNDATIASLPQGQSVTCTMTHTFTATEVHDGGVGWHVQGLINTASAVGLDPNSVSVAAPQATATTSFDVDDTADVTKDATYPTPLRAGDTIHYTVTVTNNGDGGIVNPQLVDPMLPNLASSCSPALPATMQPGFTTTCTAPYTVTEADIRDNIAAGAIKNTVHLTGTPAIWAIEPLDVTASKSVPLDTATPTVAFTGSKVATPVSANPGDTVTYTVTAKNVGQLTATNVVVYDSFKGGARTAIDPTTCVWPTASGTLKSGEQVVCSYTYRVQATDASTTIHNAASVSGDDGTTPVGPTSIGSADVDVSNGTSLTATKTNDAGTNRVKPGQSYTYTITVRNDGQAVAKGVVLSDPLPQYVEFGASVPAGDWTFDTASNTATSAPFDVPGNGGQVAKSFTVTVAADAPSEQVIKNIGVITGMATPEECAQNPAKAGCAIDDKTLTVDDSQITISKSNDVATSPKVVKPGQTYTYTVTATNSGASTATGVVITDRLPAGLSFASTSQAGWASISGDTAISKPLTVLGHDSASLTLQVTVAKDAKAGSVLRNVIATGGTSIDDCDADSSKAGCGEDKDWPTVIDHSKVTVFKTNDLAALKPRVKPGDSFTYTITAINSGATTAQQVTITDTLPAGLTFDGSQNSAWTIKGTTATLTTDVPAGTTGLSWDLRVKVAVDAKAGVLQNIAVMDNQDPAACDLTNKTNACGADPNPPYVNPVVLTKVAQGLDQGASVRRGDTITYQFAADNSKGDTDVTGYRIIDQIPAGTVLDPNPQAGWTIVSGTGAAGTVVQSTSTFTVPAGQIVTKELSVKVADNAAAGAVIDNVGTIEGGKTPIASCVTNPTLPDCVEDATQPTVDDSQVTLTKTNSIGTPAEVLVGQSFSYTITATNGGTVSGKKVTVTDQLPAGIVFDGPQDSTQWGTASGGSITSLPFDLAGKASKQLTLTVKVDPTAKVGARLTNVVALDGTSTPAQCLADTSRDGCAFDDNSPTIVDHSKVKLAKTNDLPTPAAGSQPRVKVGDTYSYTITARNTGSTVAKNVTITDTLPAGLGLDPNATQDARWTITGSGRTLTYLTDLVAGSTVSLPVHVVVLKGASGTVQNVAVLDDDPTPDCAVTPTPAGCDTPPPYVDTVTPSKVSDVADGARVAPGQAVTYTFQAVNSGKDDVANYGFIDQVPSGMVLDTASLTGWKVVSGAGAAGTVVQSNPLFTVKAGQTVTQKLTMRVDPNASNGIVIRNVGTVVNGDTPIDRCVANPALPDCYTEPTDHPVDDSDITLVKSNDVTQSHKLVTVGESYLYTIKATNSGTSDATGVTVTDVLPAGLEFVGGQDTNFWQTPSDAHTIQSVPLDIKGGKSITLTLKVKVSPGATGTLTNVSAVDGKVTPDQCAATPTLSGCGVDDNPLVVDNTAISATKTASIGTSTPVKPGESYSYSIVATNSGSEAATGVVVSDKIPAGLAWVTSADFPTPPTGGVATSIAFPLAAGATRTLTLNVQVDPNAAAGTVIDNIGAIAKSGDDGPGLTDCVKDPSLPQCFEEPGEHNVDDSTITIAKTNNLTGNPPLVTSGDTYSYDLVVTNSGNTADPNVVVTDQLPDGLTFEPTTQNGWTFSADGKTATADAFALGGKKSKNLTLSVKVAAGLPTGTVLKNVSAVKGSTSGGTDVTDCTTDDTQPGCGPDKNPPEVVDHSRVEITKVNNLTDKTVTVGQSYTYTITATNTGTLPVKHVLVSDTLPTGLAFAGSQAGWTIQGDTASFTTDLAAGQTVSKTLTVTVMPGATGTIYNIAVKDGGNDDPDQCKATNPPASCDKEPPNVDNSDVSIAKKSSLPANARVKPGQQFTYTLTATNNGTEQATGVKVTDTLPTGLTYVPVSGDGWTLGADGRTLTSDAFDLNPNGAAKSFTLTVKVNTDAQPGAVIENTGCTTGLHSNRCAKDPTPPSYDDSDIQLTKANDTATWNPTVQVGDSFTYTITATNTGHTAVTGVVVTDSLPLGLAFASTTQSGWATLSGRDATSAPFDLAGGAHVTLTLQVTVTSAAQAGDVLKNYVAVDGETTPGDCATSPTLPGCGEDHEPPTVVDHSKVTITKSNDVPVTTLSDGTALRIVKPGDTYHYTITAENTGTTLARGVKVSDTLPAGLSFSGSQNGWTLSGLTATRTIASLAAGEKVSFTLTVKVADGFSGQIENVSVLDGRDPADCVTNPKGAGCGVDPAPPNSNNVKLTKSNSLNGEGTVMPGQPFTYTITATNSGTGTASGVQIVDQLPDGVEAYPASQPNWTLSGRQATSVAFSLTAGQTRSFTLQVKVKATAAAGTQIENAAAVKGLVDPVTCLAEPTLAGCGTDPKPPLVDTDVMQIEKTDDLPAGTAAVNRGREFGYDITVRNTGYLPATAVTVHDRLPSGLVWATTSQNGWASFSGQDADSTAFDLAAGQAATLHVKVLATKSSTSLLRNVVALTGFALTSQVPTGTGGNGGASVSPPTGTAKTIDQCLNNPAQPGCAFDDIAGNGERTGIQVTKTNDVAGQVVKRGQTFTYTISVTNTTSATSKGVTVSDTLPAGLAFAATAQDGWTIDGAMATIDAFDLPAGATKSFTLKVQVTADATGSLRNVAVLDDRAPADCLAHTDLVGCGADPRPPFVDEGTSTLAVSKTAATTDVNRNGVLDAGDRISYSFTVTNRGDKSSESGLDIDDPMLAAAGITISCPTGKIAAHESVICRSSRPYAVTASDAAAGHLRNVATASAGGSTSRPASVDVTLAGTLPTAGNGSGRVTGGTGTSGSLARTGATVVGVGALAATLLAAGIVALGSARRRRRDEAAL